MSTVVSTSLQRTTNDQDSHVTKAFYITNFVANNYSNKVILWSFVQNRVVDTLCIN